MDHSQIKIFKIGRVCLIGIIVGTILRFIFPWVYNPLDSLFSDPMRHWHNGEIVFKTGVRDLMTYCDPLPFQIFIWGVRQLHYYWSGFVPLAFSLLCGVMPWIYYRAAREMGFNRNESAWVWFGMIWAPSLWVIYQYVMMETLLLISVGFALWMTFRALRKKERNSFLIASMTWLSAVMVKPTVIVLAGCFGLYLLVKVPWKWSWLCLAFLLSVILILPNSMRTYKAIGFIQPFGSSYIALIQHQSGAERSRIYWKTGIWKFASPSCYQVPMEPFSNFVMDRTFRETEVTIVADPLNKDRDWKRALKENKNRFNGFWMRQRENWILFLFSASWPDCPQTIWGRINYHFRWMIFLTIVFVLAGNFTSFAEKRWEILPIVTTVFILFLLFQPFVTMEGRYRKPLEPLLVMNLVWNTRQNKEKKHSK